MYSLFVKFYNLYLLLYINQFFEVIMFYYVYGVDYYVDYIINYILYFVVWICQDVRED